MTLDQKKVVAAALASIEAQNILSKLILKVAADDVQQAAGYQHVLEYKPLAHLIEAHERDFAEGICDREHDEVLLLGNTKAIEGFFLRSKHTLQMVEVGRDKLTQAPGAFVQAFLTKWQKAQGWRGIMLFIRSPLITTAFARQRWNTPGTQPKLMQSHLNGQISRIVVYCADGIVELPLVLPTAK